MLSRRERALAGAIRRAIADSGIGPRKIGERMRVSHSLISKWQHGAATPDRDGVARLLEAIGASPDQRGRLLGLLSNIGQPTDDIPRLASTLKDNVRDFQDAAGDIVQTILGVTLDSLAQHCDSSDDLSATVLTPADLRAIRAAL